ncbi:desferrioxamine E synthetase DesD [Streptomyces sodiiphilus]|uniref:Desferrioxamine E synthetase DesD n=1 Tax=Streptomyces sodiiphilus TaxID=226217 RepID=A0ABP5A0Y5_9ACTN
MTAHTGDPASAVAHLSPGHWDRANRLLIRKALAEFSHERLLSPRSLPGGRYTVHSDDKSVTYAFTARLLALDHWQIDADSISRGRGGEALPLDALEFFLELRDTLGLTEEILPVYLEEISSTLAGTAFRLARPELPAEELARSGFQDIEAGMAEGHPCFVANNGRLGFGSDDYLAYAPEAARPVRLVWLAVRRDCCTFSSSADLDHEQLISGELDPGTLSGFAGRLTDLGLDPAEYYYFPAHPWQWWNRLSVTFAADIARRDVVCLGYGKDRYLPQQSVRTFFNSDSPSRHYVKTALSVLNMGFVRGLSTEYMKATPAINDWLAGLLADDPVLREAGFTVIRERAAIGYHPRHYAEAAPAGSPYLKMFAALWRESPVPLLEPGQRLATMASLLHTDREGRSLAAALVRESGLEPTLWLRRYLDAYLTPLLHCFFAHDLVFMPHGENVILVLEDGVPSRAVMKDIAEEIAVLDDKRPLPSEVERVRAVVPDEIKPLSLFTDVFDCFFRFLGATLDEAGVLAEDDFWATVAGCVRDYQRSAPHLADRFDRYDLFAETFPLSCLNRLQLRNNRQMVDLQDPTSAIRLAGSLENPIARFA